MAKLFFARLGAQIARHNASHGRARTAIHFLSYTPAVNRLPQAVPILAVAVPSGE